MQGEDKQFVEEDLSKNKVESEESRVFLGQICINNEKVALVSCFLVSWKANLACIYFLILFCKHFAIFPFVY